MRLIHGLRFDNLIGDLYGGVTAAVIALPLALAFGVASGVGPMAGLYGAILIGFFAAVFGGTPTQISGPTGPMTVVMAAVVIEYANQPLLAFTVVMLAGLFQIGFGVLRLGQLISLVPFTVISGFMSGIGVIIIILQIAPLLGQEPVTGGVVGTLTALPTLLSDINLHALLVSLLTLLIVVATPKSIGRFIPSPLLALIVGSIGVMVIFNEAPILGHVPTGLPSLHLPVIDFAVLTEIIGTALVLALLGSLDSLLTSLIADSITKTHHDSNRELIGQGIGNVFAGLFGGLPGAGATMRTVINVRSGGRTPLSGIIHALVLLGIVLGAAPLAEKVPHAVLAGILVKVGFDIIDWRYISRLKYVPRKGVLVMFITLGLTVFVDLVLAVSVGVVAASLLFVKRMSDLQSDSIRSHHDVTDEYDLSSASRTIIDSSNGRIAFYHFGGPLSFCAAKDLMKRIVVGEQTRVLILDFKDVSDVDTSAAFAIEDTLIRAKEQNIHIIFVGLSSAVEKVLSGTGAFRHLDEYFVLAHSEQAVDFSAFLASGESLPEAATNFGGLRVVVDHSKPELGT